MRDKIKFENNEPVTVTLQYQEGRIVDGKFGQQVMYSLEGNRVMYLDLAVSQKINMLQPQVGESFVICKRPKNGSNPPRWDLWLSPATEQMRAQREMKNAPPQPTLPAFDPGNLYPRAGAPPSELELQLQASLDQINRQRDGANLIQRRPPAAETAAPAPPLGTGTHGPVAMPAPDEAAMPSWASHLVTKTDALIDAYAACLKHANKHGNHVKSDDVRALITTVYIAMTKNGVSHAA